MFRIRRIHDTAETVDQAAVAQVQSILRAQFPGLPPDAVERLPDRLGDPLEFGYRTVLMVAEGQRARVKGFALLLHFTDLGFAYLDFLAAARRRMGGGIGGAIYERVRDEARALDARALFLEALPDDPALCRDPEVLRQNAARLRFYERFGVRPIAGTAYETPVRAGADCPPYLLCDDLDPGRALRLEHARSFVRAILERKYRDLPPEYVERVVTSFRDDPVRLREAKYVRAAPAAPEAHAAPAEPIALVVNELHAIHHVRERGYVESPVRIASILRELERTALFREVAPKRHAERRIVAVHDAAYVRYLKKVCLGLEDDRSVYPYVFPIRNAARPPTELAVRAGYYCIDTFTPLSRSAYLAARRAVDCALTAAAELVAGRRLAYALVRPPGHHAERRAFGGFCYFNSTAIAAHELSTHGRVAILDVDYHHGNGQQEIFYDRADVLTVSIHGHPRFAFPYFTGFADERGEGPGAGFNVNLALGEAVDGAGYREALAAALRRIRRFRPAYLVVALGLDTAKGDPTGTWTLTGRDFQRNGRMIGELGLPTLVVQEGGYRTRTLGVNARHFFVGLAAGAAGAGV